MNNKNFASFKTSSHVKKTEERNFGAKSSHHDLDYSVLVLQPI